MISRRRAVAGLAALSLTASLAVAGVGSAGALGLPPKLDPEIVAAHTSGRAIVGFTHDVRPATMRRLAAAGITHAVRLDTIDAVGIVGTLDAYKEIATWDDVRYVDADSPLQMLNYQAKKDTNVDDVRKGGAPLRAKYNGKGVTVAVIDTGIDSTHPDLADRVVRDVNFEPAWIFDMIMDGAYSDQLVEATGNKVDSYGHGTHVAGIVAGTGAAADGVDMSGVAPGASLVNLKIADVHQGLTCSVPCDLGWEINALVAYEYAIEHRNDKAFPGGIRVITNSWSIYEVDSEVEPITLIVKAAADKGLVNVFAAGNDGPDRNTVAQGPNQLEEVITVAASCKSEGSCGAGNIAEFSSRGPQIDIAAPGDSIYSTMALASVDGPIGSHNPPGGPTNRAYYTGLSGTSMATPHVAGIVALMLQADPDLTPAQVEKILISTATDLGERGFDTAFGHGQVNALKAVAKAER